MKEIEKKKTDNQLSDEDIEKVTGGNGSNDGTWCPHCQQYVTHLSANVNGDVFCGVCQTFLYASERKKDEQPNPDAKIRVR